MLDYAPKRVARERCMCMCRQMTLALSIKALWYGYGYTMLSALIGLIGLCSAVFREDATFIDHKLAVYGSPLAAAVHNQTLAVVTEQNVLALYAQFGATLWRQVINPKQAQSGIAWVDDIIVLGGDYLEAFNATNGVSLWTAEHQATEVYSDDSNSQVLIDGKYTVSADGKVTELAEKVSASGPYKILDGHANLPGGLSLRVNQYGIVSLINSTGEVVWDRDDGLAHAEQAVFLFPPEQEDLQSDDISEYLERAYESSNLGVISRAINRLARHSGELVSYLIRMTLGGGLVRNLMIHSDLSEYQFDQILVVRTALGSVYGLNVTDGGMVSWVYHDLEATDIHLDDESKTSVRVTSADGNTYVLNNEGEITGLSTVNLAESDPFLSIENVDSTTIRSSMFGWEYTLPGTKIVGSATKQKDDFTALVAVPLNDDEVLYKYLNPFTSVFASYDEETQQLITTVICAVSGRILAQASNPEKVFISDEWKFSLVVGEYWFAYTYLSLDGPQTPKITVGELFETDQVNTRLSTEEVNVLEDTMMPFLSMASWLVPYGEPVYSLGVSKTRFGAAARELLLALEDKVITIPRGALSTLQPLPKLEIGQHNYLSHILGVHRAEHIVTAPTKLESTYLVATYGGPDLFMTRAAPSGDLDRLHKKFPKIKLVIFVAILAFSISALAPVARLKRLTSQWR